MHASRSCFAAAVLLPMAVGPVAAQHAHGTADASPYAEMTDREIKALSAEEVEALRAGEGMGMALAAELNGLPGPRHVLDLAEELGLDAEVRTAVQRVFDAMNARAVELGEGVVEAERALDGAFASGSATAASVRDLTARVAALRGELRAVHLEAHLATAELLGPGQRHRYAMLRGYHEGANGAGGGSR